MRPGHTPGHICLYSAAQKTLIAGDALTFGDGDLAVTPSNLNDNTGDYRQTLLKLARLDIERVICYPGWLFHGAASRRIAELASSI